MKNTSLIILSSIILFSYGCNNGPKVIESTPSSVNQLENLSSGIFEDASEFTSPTAAPQATDIHNVVVNEVLPTPKYVYLNVTEGDNSFWIATSKQEVEIGQRYFYKGGLLKTNFESKEYNRVFEKVYLVSQIVPIDHSNNPQVQKEISKPMIVDNTISKSESLEGTISIADIVSNPKKYEGKKVQFEGECIKLNANIMGRNWVHLKDGSLDDYDFVITSETAVPEGHYVTMKGILVIDKDFGSGYRYNILIENAVIVK